MADAMLDQLFYVTVASGQFDSMLGGEPPAHIRLARDLLHAQRRVRGAHDVVRERLRRKLRLLFIPSNLRPELRALFPARMTNARAHRVWIDRVAFESGGSFPAIDARALVRVPMRRRLDARTIAALEAKHRNSLASACSFEIDMPGDDTAWVVSHEGLDVIPANRASDIARLLRLPPEARQAREYLCKVEEALSSAMAPLRVRPSISSSRSNATSARKGPFR